MVYTDGGTRYDEACNILNLKHHLYSPFEYSFMLSPSLYRMKKNILDYVKSETN